MKWLLLVKDEGKEEEEEEEEAMGGSKLIDERGDWRIRLGGGAD
jgi:hypothetical protein